jgi:hypothetical protein
MDSAAILPFAEALDAREIKRLLPTELRTALLDEIPAQLRERAMFSAGVVQAEKLQDMSDMIDELLAGRIDRATARTELRRRFGTLGEGMDETDLTDLRTDTRLNLILDTNVQMAQGYGAWKQGQEPAILDAWPAQELVRVSDARVPRNWPTRWAEAGGRFFGDRMIALKNDPIWTRISRFGLPYPPFDFGSGMDVTDVDRETAIEAGLIDENTELLPQDRDFNTDLQAAPDVREQSLRTALAEAMQGLAAFDAEGVLRFTGGTS